MSAKLLDLYRKKKPKMTEEELEGLRKEIVRQMGVKSMEEAYLRGDWAKVDPELMNKYKEYAVPHSEKPWRICVDYINLLADTSVQIEVMQ